MFASAMVLLSLLQVLNHNPRALVQVPSPMQADMPQAEPDRRWAAYQEQRFTRSMNRFVATLHDFVQQYNADHSVNLKKIKALKKAWRDVEEAEPWLRQPPSK